MRYKAGITILPTEDVTDLVVFNNKTYLNNGYIEEDDQYLLGDEFSNSHQEPITAFKFQHTYITVDQDVESVKKGDWVYNTAQKNIFIAGKEVIDLVDSTNVALTTNRKIIATTNPELTIGEEDSWKNRKDILYPNKIPQLQQQFIKEYIDNPNGYFEVEYEEMLGNEGIIAHTFGGNEFKLKLNQDSTINISSVTSKI